MKASIIFAAGCLAMLCHVPASAQQYTPNSVPSEGGKKSGGGGYLPGGGGDFRFPSGGTPRYRPSPGWTPRPVQRPIQPNPWQPQPQPRPIDYGQPIQNPGVISGSTYSSASMPSAPVSTSQYVTIRCPSTARGSIYYRLESGGRTYGFTMRAGQEQRFRVSNSWTIDYNDGSRQQRYRLRGGKTYTLKNADGNRWQLYSVRSPGS